MKYSTRLEIFHAVAHLVEALRYKSEGRGFDSRWCQWNFSFTYPSGCTMALGLTQPLTEINTRNISRRPVRRADNLTTFMCQLSWNLGASTSWNPEDLSRSVIGLIYLFTRNISNKICNALWGPYLRHVQRFCTKNSISENSYSSFTLFKTNSCTYFKIHFHIHIY
jgi:hypothetical protein